jgi:thiol-disulfide isomerase/thioredoxin
MIQTILLLIPWLTVGAIVLIPPVCIVLYLRRRLRTRMVLSHLWCMITFFTLGLFVLHTARRHEERLTYADKAERLLTIVQTLRAGDAPRSTASLDELLAETLYRSAYDVPDEKMAAMNPDLLRAWQEVKEYYNTYDMNEPYVGTMMPLVRDKLSHVPWSDMQLATRKFEQTYGSGTPAPAPAINLKSWITGPLTNDDLKGKVILLDFWNTRCSPCIKAHPDLQKTHDAYKDRGLVVIACAGGDERETREYLDKHGYSFPAGMVSWRMYLDYAVRGNPTYFLIDRTGNLAWGPERRLPTDDELTKLLSVQ